ncbi:MAG: glycerate kinase [Bacillota bacterium]|nr:glycerate kinase [Bacillota bacterium]
MHIILAPDSFKGSLSAGDVAESMERGVRRVFPSARVVKLPLSDGGEGLVNSLVKATDGTFNRSPVTGPLGDPVDALWGILGDGETAVIEMAAASGLLLVPEGKRNPMVTTTYGTGELIKEALYKCCKKLIIGIGGSATNDGGAGAAQALGARFLDKDGNPLSFGGGELSRLKKIDLSGLDKRIKEIDIRVACDVNNSLTGPRGASYIYGPQKGASPEMVQQLDEGLKHYAAIISRDLGKDVDNIHGAGAAGGLGAGLMAFINGRLTPGIELVMEIVGLEKKLIGCDLIFTGEGRLDSQSAFGKVPVGVVRKAKKFDIPVVVIAGSISDDADLLHEEGITAYFSILNAPMSLQEAMRNTGPLVEHTVSEVLRLLKITKPLSFWSQA